LEQAVSQSMLAGLSFAAEVPVIEDMAIDSEDRIWISRSGSDGISKGPTDVFAANGDYLGTLADDEFRIPDAFGPDGLMAYIELDETDVPTVSVRRLVSLARSD